MDARFGFHEQGQPGRVRVPQAPRRRSSRGLGLLVFVCVAVGLAWTIRSGHKVRKQAAAWTPAQAMSGWYEGAAGYQQAMEEQRRTHRPVLIYFHVDWCPYCRRMDQDMIDSPVLRQFLAGSIDVGVNPERAPADAAPEPQRCRSPLWRGRRMNRSNRSYGSSWPQCRRRPARRPRMRAADARQSCTVGHR